MQNKEVMWLHREQSMLTVVHNSKATNKENAKFYVLTLKTNLKI